MRSKHGKILKNINNQLYQHKFNKKVLTVKNRNLRDKIININQMLILIISNYIVTRSQTRTQINDTQEEEINDQEK